MKTRTLFNAYKKSTCVICGKETDQATWYTAYSPLLGRDTIYDVCPKCNKDYDKATAAVRAFAERHELLPS